MSYVKKYYFLYPVPAAVLFCLIFFFMALAPPVFGENDESVEETSSQTGESEWRSFSINEKEDWLAEHREDPLFFNRLIETAESFENPSLSKELLHRYLSLIDDSGERHEALLMLARIEESLGNYKAAQSHYQSAALVRSEERDYEALYSSALLLIEQGDYSLAKVQLNRVLDNTESEELMRKAQLNLARLYALSGKHEQARSSIEGIMEESPSPEIYYLVHILSLHLEMDEQAGEAEQRLLKEYPRSPETQLIQGLAESAPSTEDVFGLLRAKETEGSGEETVNTQELSRKEESKTPSADGEEAKQQARGVQTGSFRDVENADYMAAELEEKGFTVEVEEKEVNGTKYNRVIVPIPEGTKAQNTIVRLKEAGFEGYPVY